MSHKILIANRGEIAVRIIRAAKELGIETVSVYSKADEEALHVKIADQAICVGGAKSSDSYLNMNHILSAAIATGCDAIHPGYGFLSENAVFVEMVESCGLRFIGPTADTIRLIGDKASAKRIAKEAGVPIIMGSEGILEHLEEALKVAKKIGYPVMIKATNGGGGRGISIAYNEKELVHAYERTSLEAEAAFGDKSLYIEKFIESPKHIEVQIIADKEGNVVHLYERDCSTQRRNQKMIEEAPAPTISDTLRKKLGIAAIKLAKKINYINAGTLEFLVDKNQDFYFIEMNTRIQVEHPITEMITGIDLVKEQINIAYDKTLSFKQRDIKILGHAIECRINAEDPMNGFRPSPGKITNLFIPGGFNVRVDTHVYQGYSVPPYYDSMVAKVIVFEKNRREAIKKMRVTLEQMVVEGIKTNIEYQYLIMHDYTFIKGNYDTGFIAKFNELVENNKNE